MQARYAVTRRGRRRLRSWREASGPSAKISVSRLAADAPAQHGTVALSERRLVHGELVGIDVALNDVFAQPVDAADQHDVAETGLGIEGERDAAARPGRSEPSS